MKTYFVETESPEEQVFRSALGASDLRFVSSLEEVEADAEALSIFIHSEISGAFLERHPKLKLIAIRSSGYDHVDLAECERRGVTVCAAPSCADVTVAEHAFSLILALARRYGEVTDACKRGKFSYAATRGFELKGKTLGVIGAGRIGLQVIRFARAFSLEVIACDTSEQPDIAEQLSFRYAPFDELLQRSHILSLHLPLNPETYHLLNRETFRRCRTGVLVVNTARGRLIDAVALIEALDQGIVAGAGLDVIEEESVMTRQWHEIVVDGIIERLQAGRAVAGTPVRDYRRGGGVQALMQNQGLLGHPNVVFTPHIAFNSVEAVERINTKTIENIKAFLAGAPVNVITSADVPCSGRGSAVAPVATFKQPPSQPGDTVSPP